MIVKCQLPEKKERKKGNLSPKIAKDAPLPRDVLPYFVYRRRKGERVAECSATAGSLGVPLSLPFCPVEKKGEKERKKD